MKLTWIGHAAVYVQGARYNVLIDPFITSNPAAAGANLTPDRFRPHGIVLSHGHFDHIEDAASIAKRTGATIVASFELANYCQGQGAPEVFGMNPGGAQAFEFGTVRLTKAFHSSSHEGQYLGAPCGIVLTTDDGVVLYHAGDTELFGDMRLIGRLYRPQVALLPIGSVFTMDPQAALEAVKLIRPQTAVPIHYDTFPPIRQDAQAFKRAVEAETDTRVAVLEPGGTLEVAARG